MADMLRLTEPLERKKVEVHGKVYEVRNIDELPFEVSMGLGDLQQALGKVAESAKDGGKLSPEDLRSMSARLRSTVGHFIVEGGEVAAGLTDAQCLRLFTYFFEKPTTPEPAAAPVTAGAAAGPLLAAS